MSKDGAEVMCWTRDRAFLSPQSKPNAVALQDTERVCATTQSAVKRNYQSRQ